MGHKSASGFLVAIKKKENPVHNPRDKEQSTQKRNYIWYLDQVVIYIKQREHYRMNKIEKIHNCQFSKDWVVSNSIYQETPMVSYQSPEQLN